MSQPPPYGEWPDPSAPRSGGWPDPHPPSAAPSDRPPSEVPTQLDFPAGAYGTPGQAPPGYGYPPGYAYPAPPSTNGMAIAALVCSLAGFATCLSAPVGAILGHVARRQIRERGQQGDGMALAGIIVGWILTGLMVAFCGLGIVAAIADSSA